MFQVGAAKRSKEIENPSQRNNMNMANAYISAALEFFAIAQESQEECIQLYTQYEVYSQQGQSKILSG